MMNSNQFEKLKNDLISQLNKEIENATNPEANRSYIIAISILKSINQGNQKAEKGRLSHFAVDSYNGNRQLGSELISFDEWL